MKEIKTDLNIVTIGDDESTRMEISQTDQHKLFDLLQSPYSNPIESIIRETATNSWDAHKEAGVEEPIMVMFDYTPSEGYSVSFVDNGIGMSPDRIKNVYTKYLKSTKTDTNDLVGYFGIGSKSPLSYVDEYYLTTRYDGIEYQYMIRKGDDGFPVLDPLDDPMPTSDRNGTTVKMFIASIDDLILFEKGIHNQLKYFSHLYVVDNSQVMNLGQLNDFKIVEGKNFIFRRDDDASTKRSDLELVIGEVRYPIDWKAIDMAPIAFNGNFSLAAKFKIGELPVTLTRESVKYNLSTKKIVRDRIDQCMKEFHEVVGKTDQKPYKLQDNTDFERYLLKPSPESMIDGNIKIDDTTFVKYYVGDLDFITEKHEPFESSLSGFGVRNRVGIEGSDWSTSLRDLQSRYLDFAEALIDAFRYRKGIFIQYSNKDTGQVSQILESGNQTFPVNDTLVNLASYKEHRYSYQTDTTFRFRESQKMFLEISTDDEIRKSTLRKEFLHRYHATMVMPEHIFMDVWQKSFDVECEDAKEIILTAMKLGKRSFLTSYNIASLLTHDYGIKYPDLNDVKFDKDTFLEGVFQGHVKPKNTVIPTGSIRSVFNSRSTYDSKKTRFSCRILRETCEERGAIAMFYRKADVPINSWAIEGTLKSLGFHNLVMVQVDTKNYKAAPGEGFMTYDDLIGTNGRLVERFKNAYLTYYYYSYVIEHPIYKEVLAVRQLINDQNSVEYMDDLIVTKSSKSLDYIFQNYFAKKYGYSKPFETLSNKREIIVECIKKHHPEWLSEESAIKHDIDLIFKLKELELLAGSLIFNNDRKMHFNKNDLDLIMLKLKPYKYINGPYRKEFFTSRTDIRDGQSIETLINNLNKQKDVD
jgi:hypothetical protein